MQGFAIGAFIEGKLMGVSSLVKVAEAPDYHFLGLGVKSSSKPVNFALLDSERQVVAHLANQLPARRDLLVGNLDEPYLFTVGDIDPLWLYPNPATDHVEIDFYLPESGHLIVEILELSGKVMATQNFEELPSGNLSITLDDLDKLLESGTYLVQVRQGHDVLTAKLIKQ